MIEKELVTIILPTIGRPNYIVNTLNSILSQDYENLEILISDNLPKISTKEIIKDISDSRIRIIERDKRYDFSEHMNLCINESLGHYIMILSDDDLITPCYISNMVKAFDSDNGIYVGIGCQKILTEHEFTLEYKCGTNITQTYDGINYIVNDFSGKRNLPIYTYISLFAKKKNILSLGGFKEYKDGSHADNYLFYSLASKGRIVVIDDLMGYRIYKKSFGLSTPFDNLYDATKDYSKDMSALIWSLKALSAFQKIKLCFRIKISSISMMNSRLKTIYALKYDKTMRIRYKLRTYLKFWF